MPNLVVVYFGPGTGKPKTGKGKHKPNYELGPNLTYHAGTRLENEGTSF
jgi:hypothetical protein